MNRGMFSCDKTKALLHDKPPQFSFLHCNIRSLRKHHDDLINFLSILDHNFSIICLSETWLTQVDGNLFDLPGYISEHSYRGNQRSGGSAIFVNSSIAYTRRLDLSFRNLLCESVWLEFDRNVLPLNNMPTILASIYRSPSSSYSDFCSQLEEILNLLTNENKNIIICGDININILPPSCQSCSDYINCLFSYGFSSLIDVPTRCDTAGSRTLIDHIFSSSTSDYTTGVIDYSITDHYPLFFVLGTGKRAQHRQYTKNSFNEALFARKVHDTCWNNVFREDCPEKAYSIFLSTITNYINDCTTHVTHKHTFSSPRNPWITNALLRSIIKKNNLHKKVKLQPFNASLRARFKNYSNILSSVLKRAKREYYERRIIENGTNTRRNWELIKEFLNVRESDASIKKIIYKDKEYSTEADMSNVFSDHFAACQNTLSLSVPAHLPRSPQSFFLRPVSSSEVFNVISSLKVTGPGLDSIRPSRIKLVAADISLVFADIANKIFRTGIFPELLKRGKIIPVYKKGSRDNINNYRPICILPFFGKVIEKLIYSRLMHYLNKFNLLSPHQFGFRNGYSTEQALLKFTDNIKQFIDEGFVVGAIFIDLTKAFDTLEHSILLDKLESFGITGPTLNLIRSYLSNRPQVVYLNGQFSSTKLINCGVPQGSILGPLLFLLFINDLPNTLTFSKCLLYADDTTIYSPHKSLTALQDTLNADLNNVHSWCRNNKLQINPTKTTFVLFHSPQTVVSSSITVLLDNYTLLASDNVKFLGVTLDKHLKYNSHANSLIKRVSFGIRIIITTRAFFQPHVLISLYHAYINSHLSYCLSSWGNTYAIHLKPLQRLQNQAIKLMTFSPFRCHSLPIYQHLRILPIQQLFYHRLSLITYRLIHREISLDNIPFHIFVNNNNTRFSERNNFLLPKIRSNYGRYTARFFCVHLWNNIPLHVKSSHSLQSFKHNMKSILLIEPLVHL